MSSFWTDADERHQKIVQAEADAKAIEIQGEALKQNPIVLEERYINFKGDTPLIVDMAAKLVILLLIVALILSVAILAAFWYFKEAAELNHEQEMKQMEQTEKLFDTEFSGDNIDRELDKEKKR